MSYRPIKVFHFRVRLKILSDEVQGLTFKIFVSKSIILQYCTKRCICYVLYVPVCVCFFLLCVLLKNKNKTRVLQKLK